MATLPNGLTVKQDIFVKEVLKDGNGTRAALVAYNITDKPIEEIKPLDENGKVTPEYNTAKSIATENLTKPAVKQALADMASLAKDVLNETLNYNAKDDEGKVIVPLATLKANTAKDILDRTGYKAKSDDDDKPQTTNNVTINFIKN